MAGLLVTYVLRHIMPSIAITVRRLHDANLSEWLYLLSLIPYVGGASWYWCSWCCRPNRRAPGSTGDLRLHRVAGGTGR